MHRPAYSLVRSRLGGHAPRAPKRQTHLRPPYKGQTHWFRGRQWVHIPHPSLLAGSNKPEILLRFSVRRRRKTSSVRSHRRPASVRT
eukprot:2036874-Pleurochrysis_carterae.AAC.2